MTTLTAPAPSFAPPEGAPADVRPVVTTRQRPATSGRWLPFAYVVSGPVTMSLFIVAVVGLGLIPVTVGIGLVALSVPATRWIANRHRHAAAALLGQPVPAPYRPDRTGSWLGRMAGWAKDPQSWRDLAWLLVSCTVGWTLALLTVCLLLLVPFFLAQPLLKAVTDGAFDQNYGVFHAQSVADGFLEASLAIPAFLLWWYVGPVLTKLVARIDRALLR